MQKEPVLFFKEGACSLGAMISMLWLAKPFYLSRLEEGDNQNEDFLTLNGLGEVPTLFLDGTIITENSAILQHIALQDLSKNLIFTPGTPEYDQFSRALGFLTSTFHKTLGSIHLDGMNPTKAKANIHEILAYTNEHLLRTTFMFDRPMAIDAYLFAMARWGNALFNYEKEFPHIKRFQGAMAKDAGVKLALQIESGRQVDAIGPFLGLLDFKTFVKEAAARKCEVDAQKGDGIFTPGLRSEGSPEREERVKGA